MHDRYRSPVRNTARNVVGESAARFRSLGSKLTPEEVPIVELRLVLAALAPLRVTSLCLCAQAAPANVEENSIAGNLEAMRERRETVIVLWPDSSLLH